ncbi:MAG TPA: prepilin-type N-terminal cleavage/methylation domain-containing protein [Candidatus Paceibacterota bacterium]|nr:prepilin-type N-terminal cleavage/methylation domain-containing protein [Candidatus Paceibacterota bacterium]
MKLTTNNLRRTTHGFTLVETLVYIGILVVLFLALTNAIIVVSRSYNNLVGQRAVAASIISTYDRLAREIRNATSIDTADSTFNSSPGTLAIFVGTGSSQITRKFYLSGGAVAVSDNGVFEGNLTSAQASTTSLIFRLLTATTTDAVRVQMTISPTTTPSQTVTVYDTFVVRSTYEQ